MIHEDAFFCNPGPWKVLFLWFLTNLFSFSHFFQNCPNRTKLCMVVPVHIPIDSPPPFKRFMSNLPSFCNFFLLFGHIFGRRNSRTDNNLCQPENDQRFKAHFLCFYVFLDLGDFLGTLCWAGARVTSITICLI